MKAGDIVVKIDDVFKVTFQGYIAGDIGSYCIEFNVPGSEGSAPDEIGYYPPYDKRQEITGNVTGMLEHVATIIRTYNAYVVGQIGGRKI